MEDALISRADDKQASSGFATIATVSQPQDPTERRELSDETKPTSGVTSDDSVRPVGRQLRKTCEACARSKVKCEGNKPCERCTKRGVDCVYLMEQKRGRRMGSTQDSEKAAAKVLKLDIPKKQLDTSRRELSQATISTPQHAHAQQLKFMQLQQASQMFMPSQMHGPFGPSMMMRPHSAVPIYPYQNLISNQPSLGRWPLSFPVPAASVPKDQYTYATNSNSHVFPFLPHLMQQPTFPQNGLTGGSIQLPQELPLTISQQRVVRVLFALFKSQRTLQSSLNRKAWFDQRFCIVWKLLAGRIPADESYRFATWMTQNGVALEAGASDRNMTSIIPEISFKHVNALVGLERGPKLGTVRLAPNGLCEMVGDFGGFSSLDLHSEIPIPGLLPFGGDIVAALTSEDQDSLTFMQEALASAERAKRSKESKINWQAPVHMKRKDAPPLGVLLVCEAPCTIHGSDLVHGPVEINVFALSKPGHGWKNAYGLGPWFGQLSGSIHALLTWIDAE